MLFPELDWKICQVCQPCEARSSCNTRAIVQIDDDEPPYIDISRCNSCGQCVLSCPHNAIIMVNGHQSAGIPHL
ncbi:MAG: 4Fe-4S binding protein [Anaerolineales bacterium]|nr:4Fe-4S binding protein [Anaerolineales bacterium]